MITIEELRKAYEEGGYGALCPVSGTGDDCHNAALLSVARFVAERQRAVEPTEEMVNNACINAKANCSSIYRAMSAIAQGKGEK